MAPAAAARRVPKAVRDAKRESRHLWLCLLALGFDPKCHRDVRLGRDMFAKPNNRAFTVIAQFLFTKLDKRRAKLTFKHAGLRKTASPRFRKQCCLWLREIASRKERGFPRITPSTLICPGGARFIHMAYCFARYVLIEDMKKLSVGTGIPFAEAVKRRPKDIYIARARHRVAYNKLLQILQRQDFVIQEYGKKARVLIREIQRTKSEYAVMRKRSHRMKQNDRNKNDTTDRIQKVRSMWTLTAEMLTSLKKEKAVVDSVLEDCAHPCILDGTDVVLRVPGLLTYRVESDIHGFCTGNLYEDGKLNFLTVIQLLNEALRMLRDEHCPCELKELHRIKAMVAYCKKLLQDLNSKSLRNVQQCCEQKRQSISRKQEIWESKWETILGQCPSNLIFRDYLEPASPLQSFSSSDEDEDTICCQSFADNYDSCHEESHGKDDGALETMMDTTLVPSRCDFMHHGDLFAYEATDSSSVLQLPEAFENRDLLIENNSHTETCVRNKKPVPPKILKHGKEEFPTSEMEENAGEDGIQPKSSVKKEDLLEKARDELAEEVAKSVMSESPDSGEEKGVSLERLISSLSFNPFLTRKQIPRTPEVLLTEIRSSWRKAIQTEGSLDKDLSPTEVVTDKSSMDGTPSMQENSTFVFSEPASPVSDFDPPVSEKKSQLSSTESHPHEQVSISRRFESSDSKLSGIQESERTESEELGCSALSGSSVEDLSQTFHNEEKSMNIPESCLKSGRRTNTLPSEHCRSFLMDEVLCWNVSSLNSVSHETTDVGILDETLPECDSMDLSISSSSNSISYTIDSANITDVLENDEDIKKSDLDIQSLSNSPEMLKKTTSESEEELHQTHNKDESERYAFELSPIPEEEEENGDDPYRDEGLTKMLLPNSPNESKYSLSSSLVSCQEMEEMPSWVHEVP
ncbi:HAUS augmin-like complex subunit 6 [Corvus kubaryi]|uniref:HAUS augmin-like complex subunit 6 n=1 Tax=Corvus kubaryi TaxID=68294 RepID=UPI001C053F1C|nr:HAUS augmin-like complex subunit 6 [Corvus kubaryi]XP_041868704.1 HAUS augmin-like complex subunit 6 [Corvus kubaryi]